MTDRNRDLCLALMHAETEEEIESLLFEWWEDESAWRLLGDVENNFSTAGNQQSDPIAALVEKIVNSIDARLMAECLAKGIDPTGPDAPQSQLEAVVQFFEPWHHFNPGQRGAGEIGHWGQSLLTEQSRSITVTATGPRPTSGVPSITISDDGEGQTPGQMPETFMSLNKSNKLRVPFVQGKFNMGGTGALQFGGTRSNLQLIISRRRQDLLGDDSGIADHLWGFSIIRRFEPSGDSRNSVYRYLAPDDGHVLSFAAERFPLFPNESAKGNPIDIAYGREAEHGSLVKIYSYQLPGDKSSITGRTGLGHRIEAMLPRAILPLRFVEARYDRHSGMAAFGVQTRLERESERVLEDNMPITGELAIDGASLPVTVYVFQIGRASTYRPSALQAVAFTVNGQTHAWLSSRFFTRQSVRLSYLSKELFVVVDCSSLDPRAREDLFMNSRDRMREGPAKQEIEAALAQLLRGSERLAALQQERREAALVNRLAEQGVTRNIAADVLQQHEVLRRALSEGTGIQLRQRGEIAPEPFHGQPYPTFFELIRPKPYQGVATIAVAQGSRITLTFGTDALDGYFDERSGEWTIRNAETKEEISRHFHRRGPERGTCVLWSNGLSGGYEIGDILSIEISITDDKPDRIEPFKHEVWIEVKEKPSPSGGSRPKKPRRDDTADLPAIRPVWRKELENGMFSGISFEDDTAVEVQNAGAGASSAPYDLFIYMNNKFLNDARGSDEPNQILDSRWISIMTLLAMGLVVDRGTSADEDQSDVALDDVETLVRRATRSVAPVVLHLGAIFEEETPSE